MIGLVTAIVAGCTRAPDFLPPASLDPDATFAVHRVHDGFAIDRLDDGRTGMVEGERRGLGTGSRFGVREDGRVIAAIALFGPGAARLDTPAGRLLATVEPSWDDQAIRLTVHTADGLTLRSTTFARVGGAGTSVVTRSAPTTLDLRGTFRSALRGPDDRVVGWLEARLWGPSEPYVLQGTLPRELPRALGPAMAVALGSELDWIEDHATDVYRGGGGARPGGERGR